MVIDCGNGWESGGTGSGCWGGSACYGACFLEIVHYFEIFEDGTFMGAGWNHWFQFNLREYHKVPDK